MTQSSRPFDRRLVIYVVASNFMLYFGFQVWQTLFNNFAVEKIALGPAAVGLIQAVREVPGLLVFFVAVLAFYVSEVRIMAVSTILLGAGMILTGQASSMAYLLIATLIMSFGFHYFVASNSAVILMAVAQEDTAKMLGRLGSLGSIASLAGTGLVYLFARSWGYRTLYVIVGILGIAVGLLLLPRRGIGEGLPTRRRVVLRKRYWLYYSLSFLLGSRRHIFTTFAIFLLVREYGISIQTTAILYMVNSLINVLTLHWTGRLVGRWGERLSLSLAFAALTFVFLGYAFVTYLPALFLLFVLDNVLFGFELALSTYFQKIAVDQAEITSNVSVQQAINHIAAIVVPLVGGTAWSLYGSQAPFLFGAVIVFAAFLLAQLIRLAPAPAPVGAAASR